MDGTSFTHTTAKQRTNTFWHWRLADAHQRLFDHPAGVPLVRFGVCGPKWVDWGECEAAKVKTALGPIATVQVWEGYTVEEALEASDLFRATFYGSLDACLDRLRKHIKGRLAAKKSIGPWYFPLS
ncbi:MAG: hypothetical protein O3A90_14120 [Proteobacteria bacterium]|nr:hypothetical protein [Pseudomonadota bacterium]MDA0852885.1 hypothetical protein [Pseudomonadota bacterium]